MTIAEILVPLTGEKRDRVALKTAIAAARPFAAHITAFFVHLDPKYAYPYAAIPISPVTVEDVVADAETVAARSEKHARSLTTAVMREADVELIAHAQKKDRVTCSFVSVMGLFHDAVLKQARLCDLVVFGPLATDDDPDISAAFLDALMRVDVPLLIAPRSPAAMVGSVAVGWDGSSVAAHAVRTALPFLKQAASVEILTADSGPHDKSVDSLKDYLSLHGIAARQSNVTCAGRQTGEALLAGAQDKKADMLVMGAYGHSYWREVFFGGATAHVRWHATLPVLMVH